MTENTHQNLMRFIKDGYAHIVKYGENTPQVLQWEYHCYYHNAIQQKFTEEKRTKEEFNELNRLNDDLLAEALQRWEN